MASKSEQPLLPAYLVTGADELKRAAVVKRLRTRAAQEGDLEFNSETFSAERATGEEVVAACNLVPFASNLRLVTVEAVEAFKKDDREQIVAYLKNPSPTTVLALVSKGVPKSSTLYKAVAKLGKNAVIDCAPPAKRELPEKVRAMAVSHGVTITPAAVSALIDRVGENTVALDGQLAKLALAHSGQDPVTENEVVQMVTRTAEAKPWEFVDAFSQRNIAKCLLLRERLGSVTAYQLMPLCVTRVRELIMARALLERGQIGALPGMLGVPDWRVKNHGMWARSFSKAELRRALIAARDAEAAMKSGTDPESAFEQWWLGVLRRSR